MAKEQEDTIQEHWLNSELPGINCLVFSDGSATLLNIYTVNDNAIKKQYAFPVCDTTIESLYIYNDDIWTEIEKSPNDLLLAENVRIVCGEGGMGNEGFVAKIKGGHLVWALFSTESNPFIRLEATETSVKAYSNTSICYEIDIEDPRQIRIIV